MQQQKGLKAHQPTIQFILDPKGTLDKLSFDDHYKFGELKSEIDRFFENLKDMETSYMAKVSVNFLTDSDKKTSHLFMMRLHESFARRGLGDRLGLCQCADATLDSNGVRCTHAGEYSPKLGVQLKSIAAHIRHANPNTCFCIYAGQNVETRKMAIAAHCGFGPFREEPAMYIDTTDYRQSFVMQQGETSVTHTAPFLSDLPALNKGLHFLIRHAKYFTPQQQNGRQNDSTAQR